MSRTIGARPAAPHVDHGRPGRAGQHQRPGREGRHQLARLAPITYLQRAGNKAVGEALTVRTRPRSPQERGWERLSPWSRDIVSQLVGCSPKATGPAWLAGIERYQAQQELPVTGAPDTPTMAALAGRLINVGGLTAGLELVIDRCRMPYRPDQVVFSATNYSRSEQVRVSWNAQAMRTEIQLYRVFGSGESQLFSYPDLVHQLWHGLQWAERLCPWRPDNVSSVADVDVPGARPASDRFEVNYLNLFPGTELPADLRRINSYHVNPDAQAAIEAYDEIPPDARTETQVSRYHQVLIAALRMQWERHCPPTQENSRFDAIFEPESRMSRDDPTSNMLIANATMLYERLPPELRTSELKAMYGDLCYSRWCGRATSSRGR